VLIHSSDNPADRTSRRSWPLWVLPLLMVVWVNVHGGFLVGFVLARDLLDRRGVAVVQVMKGDRFEDVLQEDPRPDGAFGRWLLSGIVSAAATLVNPYGFKLHVHIYRYLSNRFLMDHIDEFQSPNFHYVAQKCFAGLLLLTLVALAAKRREARREPGPGGALFAVYAGLYASRNIPVSSLLLILVIGPGLSDAMERLAETNSQVEGSRMRWRAPDSTIPPHRFFSECRLIELSLRGPPLADRGNRADLLDRSTWRQAGRQAPDGCTL
jgi:hypothetical protein